MTVPEIIAMCERRITYLQSLLSSASTLGDMAQVERIEAEIAETQATLNSLRTLS